MTRRATRSENSQFQAVLAGWIINPKWVNNSLDPDKHPRELSSRANLDRMKESAMGHLLRRLKQFGERLSRINNASCKCSSAMTTALAIPRVPRFNFWTARECVPVIENQSAVRREFADSVTANLFVEWSFVVNLSSNSGVVLAAIAKFENRAVGEWKMQSAKARD